MRSIKPGRGPSMLSGITGIFMIGFGILWTVFAAQADLLFALFGILWTGIAITITVYNLKNAKSKDRYSEYDITEDGEEPDPFNERFGNRADVFERWTPADSQGSKYCPYCGAKAENDFEFCNQCGKKLP